MQKTYSSPCSRCGTERIVLKTWKEKLDANEVTCTQKICPNPECQKMVDREINSQKEKKDALAQKKAERLMARRAERDAMIIDQPAE
jgi:hypothetical protein